MRGRCAGCGVENASCKVIRSHCLTCPDFAELMKVNSAAALDPEKEYQRYKLMEGSSEARLEGKDDRIAANRAVAMERHGKQSDRWKKKRS